MALALNTISTNLLKEKKRKNSHDDETKQSFNDHKNHEKYFFKNSQFFKEQNGFKNEIERLIQQS